ncbi:hypothetical protein C8R43DRAFT_1040213 [Mycena crocata]|nr:hypothetical protein C8R43DRAFT_1040213 [Mycena crocata]
MFWCFTATLFLCSFPSQLFGFRLKPQHASRDVSSEANLSSYTLRPQEKQLSFDLTPLLSPAYTTLTQPLVPAPTGCTSSAYNSTDECTAEMTALSVRFEDCGDSFTVCRCSNATMSMGTVIERLGRVPVGLRRYAGHVVALKNNETEPHAYTLTVTGDTRLFGDCEMNIWVHEMMHAFDLATDATQSGTTRWRAALKADSCVPDNYALTNAIEAFAQLGVLKTYMLLHSGSLPRGFSAACMRNQLTFLNTLSLFDPGPLFGNTCAIKDNGPPARHTIPPATLDISRTFNPMPSSTNSAGSLLNPSLEGKSLIMSWTIISSVVFCVLSL